MRAAASFRSGFLVLLVVLAAALAAASTACRSPLEVAPGTPSAQVRARFGPPAAEYRLAGSQVALRYEYDTGWSGQRTYMVDFGADGRALQAWQTRTGAHFATIRIGVDTTESILREFGRPWQAGPRPGFPRQAVWDYPYLQAGAWESMVSVTFDERGTVLCVANGPDPRHIVSR